MPPAALAGNPSLEADAKGTAGEEESAKPRNLQGSASVGDTASHPA